MRRLTALAVLLLTLVAVHIGLTGTAAVAAPRTAATLDVTFERAQVTTVLGGRFTLHTRVVNSGSQATDPSIAHLNVASLTSDVYVDPEDWSSHRTQRLPSLAGGASSTLSWNLQAVNAGSFDVYVVILPNGATSAGKGPLSASPPVHVATAARQTLNAGGSLPIVIAVPIVLGLLAGSVRYRIRRRD